MNIKNPKLIALYKEFPWLTQFNQLLNKNGGPDIVKVNRFGLDVLNKNIGYINSEYSHEVYGYLIDDNGVVILDMRPQIGSIKKILISFLEDLGRSSKSIPRLATTVKEALVRFNALDEIRYAVIYNDSAYDNRLTVYKVVKGTTVNDVLELDKLEHKEEYEKLLVELNKKLKNELVDID